MIDVKYRGFQYHDKTSIYYFSLLDDCSIDKFSSLNHPICYYSSDLIINNIRCEVSFERKRTYFYGYQSYLYSDCINDILDYILFK